MVRQFISEYPQRGLLIVISDFLDDADCEKPLQYLADFGHELMLVQVWAEEDRTPPWEGELELVDAESGARLRLEFDALRANSTPRHSTMFARAAAHCASKRRAVRGPVDLDADRRGGVRSAGTRPERVE